MKFFKDLEQAKRYVEFSRVGVWHKYRSKYLCICEGPDDNFAVMTNKEAIENDFTRLFF